ncbi:hypothetical protein PpBr36_02368, partial [Pyricularia pennisetigena]|uniref:hypothetical protein n=1 Tax=Pyricularia pennisetigena TaxID=1578925 RepID=UPI001153DF74
NKEAHQSSKPPQNPPSTTFLVSSNVPFPPFKSRPIKRRLTLGPGQGSVQVVNPHVHVRNAAEETPILAHPLLFLRPPQLLQQLRRKFSANSNTFGCNFVPSCLRAGCIAWLIPRHWSQVWSVQLSPQAGPKTAVAALSCVCATCIHHLFSSLPAVNCCASRLAVKRMALFLFLAHSISNHDPALPCPASLSSGYHLIPAFTISPRKAPSSSASALFILLPVPLSWSTHPRCLRCSPCPDPIPSWIHTQLGC